ncbi:hypothetical protein DWY22_07300, partial [Heyndrickxia coagulans]
MKKRRSVALRRFFALFPTGARSLWRDAKRFAEVKKHAKKKLLRQFSEQLRDQYDPYGIRTRVTA